MMDSTRLKEMRHRVKNQGIDPFEEYWQKRGLPKVEELYKVGSITSKMIKDIALDVWMSARLDERTRERDALKAKIEALSAEMEKTVRLATELEGSIPANQIMSDLAESIFRAQAIVTGLYSESHAN